MAANTPISLSNVNVLLNEAANTPIDFDSQMFRALAGNAALMTSGTPISFSTLNNANAMGYGGIYISLDQSNVAGFGLQTAFLSLKANTSMYGANVVWSLSVNSGNNNATLVTLNNGYDSNVSLSSNVVGSWVSNVNVTCTLSFNGHLIGSSNTSYNITAQVYNPAMVLSGNTNVVASGYTAQTVSTIIQVSANSSLPANASYQFIVSPNTGFTTATNFVNFTSFTSTRGTTNSQSWSLTTNLLYNNQIIATNTVTVNAVATYLVPTFNFSAPATTNAQFANAAPTTASLSYTASQNISGANISWSISGGGTLVSNSTAANVYITSTANTYGFQQANGVITATVYLVSNGYILTTNSSPYSLEVGNYGLTYTPPATSVLANGYLAQTASTSASASWIAGNFVWSDALNSGTAATFTPSYATNSATVSLTLSTNAPASLSSVNTLTGLILSPLSNTIAATVSTQTTLTATQLPYSFIISGPTSNTLINANPSVTLSASSNVVSPTFTFSFSPSSPLVLNTTSNTATLSLTNTSPGACASSGTLTTQLFSNNILIATNTQSISLALYNPNIVWSGTTSASNVGYAAAEPISTTLSATIAPGATALNTTTTQTSTPAAPATSSVSVGTLVTNTTQMSQTTTFNAQQGSGVVGNVMAAWNVTAVVTYNGVTANFGNTVSLTSGVIDSGASLTWANTTVAQFAVPVTATTTMTATANVPSGTWAFSSSGSNTSISGNTVSLTATESSAASSNTTNATVTATLDDANGNFVKSLTANLATTATSTNPALVLSGPSSVTSTNNFNTTAVANYSASVSPNFANPTYYWSISKVSGTTANTVTSSGNTAQIDLGFSGAGSVTATYTVTVAVANGTGSNLASQSITTTLTANCPAPTYVLSISNAANSGYNYPVTATATVSAYTSPADGSTTISYSLASGSSSGITVTQTGSGATCSYSFAASESSIGTVSAVYNVTASYYTSSGVLLAQKTGQVSVSAQRLNVGLGLSLPLGGTTSYSGFGTVSGTNHAQATLSSGIGGVTYSWTNGLVGGGTSTFSTPTANTYQMSYSSGSTSSSTYQIGVQAILNGQVIAGPVYTNMAVSVTSCYFKIDAAPSTSVSANDGSDAQISLYANTNYPYSGTWSWSYTKTGGSGASAVIIQNGTNGNTLNFDQPIPGNSSYTVSTTVPGTGVSNSTSIYLNSQASCVDVYSWVVGEDGLVLAGQVTVDDWLLVTDPADFSTHVGVVQHSSRAESLGRRIVTALGVTLKCSKDAKIPYDLDGQVGYAKPDDLLGKMVPVEINGNRLHDLVVEVQDIGKLEVQHLTVENACFWAGEKPGLYMLHHNKKAGTCVDVRSFYLFGTMDLVEEGHTFALSGGMYGLVRHQKKVAQRAVRVLTDDGVSLVCSRQAPIATVGGLMEAQNLLGERVFTSVHGHQSTGRIIGVEEVGWRNVNHVWTSII